MDTSYQVSVQLAKQGRRILEIDLWKRFPERTEIW
jgi:hypothetical protein